MYRCKECGTEYKEKPDYCDCGNDEFDIVEEEKNIIKSENNEKTTQEETKAESQKPKPQPASAVSFHTQPQKVVYKPQIEPVSLIIFCICLLLSMYVVFFAWNPKESDIKQEEKQETNIVKNIPSIDKLWNNTPPAAKITTPKEEVKPIEVVTNTVKQIIPTVKPIEQKKVQPLKTTTVQQKKASTVQQKKSNTSANTSTKTTTVDTKQQAQKAAEEAAKKKAEQERKAAEEAQIKKLQAEQAKKLAEQKAKQAEAEKQEFTNYKANLRNTIGRKIDFTRVIGDGSCTVSFKIDANGKLTNRSFSKQSSNNTLNDAVYAAVMATPTFNPPPAAYNNEFLKLNISFYNGNFEISLP